MNEKKRPSGSEYRKRKLNKEKEIKKLKGGLNKYLKILNPSLKGTEVKEQTDAEYQSAVEDKLKKVECGASESGEENRSFEKNEIGGIETSACIQRSNVSFCENNALAIENNSAFNFNDAATWPKIDITTRKIIIEKGPIQVGNIDFPVDKNGRKFSIGYYFRKLSNNEKVPRCWLLYSIKCNAVFCFCCKLFSEDTKCAAVIQSQLIFGGYSNWQNLSKTLSVHEVSESHMKNFKIWIDLKRSMELKCTIDNEVEKMFDQEKRYWRAVTERIFEIVKFLGIQCLAFRGSSNKLFENSNGNFLKLVELLSKFDLVMSNHIQRPSKNALSYLSNDIQNEIISLISKNILKKIVELIKKAKYYSIILDCTPDQGHVEQMSVIVRFLNIDEKSPEAIVLIEEHFLGFIPVTKTTGEALTMYLLQTLKELDLDVQDLRGQSYDNASNMKGKNIGVQRQILNINPRALFIPCSAHSLNLVVTDTVKVNSETISFFGIVQKLYNFFSASTKRWDILKKRCKITLKPLSDTRWSSRIDALRPLRQQMEQICDSLEDICDDPEVDKEAKYEAETLTTKIQDFKFLCSLILWYDVLYRINIINEGMTQNIHSSVEHVSKLKTFILEYRTEKGFENVIEQAKELADKLEVPSNFKLENESRTRRKKRMFHYESKDEQITNQKDKFKVNFFYVILDTIITTLEERLKLLKNHCNSFVFLTNLKNFKKLKDSELLQKCQDLEKILTKELEKDIESKELLDELRAIGDFLQLEECDKPTKILQYILANNLKCVFPNLMIALRIFLTLPVSIASGERSFSRLKLIKNYLRSTMSQDRLVGLSVIAIEPDICNKLNTEKLIDEFASLKARKVKL